MIREIDDLANKTMIRFIPGEIIDITDDLKNINWSNFTLYMPVDDKGNFTLVESCEKELGINISYTEDIDDNATFFAKIKPLLDKGESIGRDLIVVTDDFVLPWINGGFVEKFDKQNMPNVSNHLIESYFGAVYDPERNYTIPWQSGFTGIGFNSFHIISSSGTRLWTWNCIRCKYSKNFYKLYCM